MINLNPIRFIKEQRVRFFVRALLNRIEEDPTQWYYDRYTMFIHKDRNENGSSYRMNSKCKISTSTGDNKAPYIVFKKNKNAEDEVYYLTRGERRAIKRLHKKLCNKGDDLAFYNAYLEFLGE